MPAAPAAAKLAADNNISTSDVDGSGKRGQVLVQLDPSDTEVALQQAEAKLAGTVRQVRGLYRSVEGAQTGRVYRVQ